MRGGSMKAPINLILNTENNKYNIASVKQRHNLVLIIVEVSVLVLEVG